MLLVFIIINVVLLLGAVSRLPKPVKPADSPEKVVVVGDSLTAGEYYDSIDKYWPDYLARAGDFEVNTLARPGARLVDGAKYIKSWLEKNHTQKYENIVFFILLGGNDLLAPRSSVEFKNNFSRVLEKINTDRYPTYVFELPRPPLEGKYGIIQRRLTEKYNARLINRIYLSRVMIHPANTTDGIHLSPRGHRKLTELVLTFLNPG